MGMKRTAHAVYETKYHIVWAPKYRKWILKPKIRERIKELFVEIAQSYDMEIDEQEADNDHVHIFLSFPPRYSIGQVVKLLKGISSRIIFKEYPEVKCWKLNNEPLSVI